MRLAKLNRTMSHRHAMFRNMVSSLIEHEQIKTTLPKAKAVSRLAERVITWTKAGSDNIFYQRKAESYLMNWTRVRNHLFQNLAKRYENRVGGYTRIHRLGHRADDHAPFAIIELVDNARDLKRDKVIRTASRELALLELSRRTAPNEAASQAKVPSEIWRNVVLKEEAEAKGVIEKVQRLLPALTNRNLEKVLSEQYVKAYQYCQPVSIPTKEEARAEIVHMKNQKRKHSLMNATELDSSGSPTRQSFPSIPTPTALPFKRQSGNKPRKAPPLARSVGLPTPIGAYTDFLYNLRLHFHRNLATLDSSTLTVRSRYSTKNRIEKLGGTDGIVSFDETDEHHLGEGGGSGPQRPFGSEPANDLKYWDMSNSKPSKSSKLRQAGRLIEMPVVGSPKIST